MTQDQIDTIVVICSDYDEECQYIDCPTKCWIGNELTGGNADGVCPLMSNG